MLVSHLGHGESLRKLIHHRDQTSCGWRIKHVVAFKVSKTVGPIYSPIFLPKWGQFASQSPASDQRAAAYLTQQDYLFTVDKKMVELEQLSKPFRD